MCPVYVYVLGERFGVGPVYVFGVLCWVYVNVMCMCYDV